MKRDHNPLRYFPWLLRDSVMWPLRLFAILGVLLTLIVWRFAANMQMPRRPLGLGATAPADIAQFVQFAVWTACLTVAILMTVAGMTGTDLERGYYRSWFSKPMSALWYYLQRYLIGAVVVLCLPLVLGVGLKLALGTGYGLSWALIGQIALAYLLIASATLLLSLFIARGWLIVFVVDILQAFAERLVRTGFAPKWVGWVHAALPPFHKLGAALPLPTGSDLWQIVGYGSGMLIVALVLLRVRPLGAGTAA